MFDMQLVSNVILCDALIGTTSGGNDVFPFENVGTVQHKALHGLNLQNGYKYYATIKGKINKDI